jgi:hypothetical protein
MSSLRLVQSSLTPKQADLRAFAHARGYRVRFADVTDPELPVHLYRIDDSSRPAARCATIDEARDWLVCETLGEP